MVRLEDDFDFGIWNPDSDAQGRYSKAYNYILKDLHTFGILAQLLIR